MSEELIKLADELDSISDKPVSHTAILKAASALRRLAAAGEQKPVAWRWKPKGSESWIYNPDAEWLSLHKNEVGTIDLEPVYTAVPQPAPAGESVTVEKLSEFLWPNECDLYEDMARALLSTFTITRKSEARS